MSIISILQFKHKIQQHHVTTEKYNCTNNYNGTHIDANAGKWNYELYSTTTGTSSNTGH